MFKMLALLINNLAPYFSDSHKCNWNVILRYHFNSRTS